MASFNLMFGMETYFASFQVATKVDYNSIKWQLWWTTTSSSGNYSGLFVCQYQQKWDCTLTQYNEHKFLCCITTWAIRFKGVSLYISLSSKLLTDFTKKQNVERYLSQNIELMLIMTILNSHYNTSLIMKHRGSICVCYSYRYTYALFPYSFFLTPWR